MNSGTEQTTVRNLAAGFDKFQEKAASSGDLYFKMKNIPEGKPVVVRFLPWIASEQVVELLPHYEGWVDFSFKDPEKKTEEVKSRPVKFYPDDEIPAMNWSVGTGQYDNGKTKTPEGVIACLVYTSIYQKVQIASFGQKVIIQKLMPYINPSSELYLNGRLCDYEFILVKSKNASRTEYSIDIKVKSSPLSKNPNIVEALREFASDGFSFDEYMLGNDPFTGMMPEHTGIEEYDIAVQNNRQQPAQRSAQQPAQQRQAEPQKQAAQQQVDWKDVKTPKGRRLGDLTLDELKTLKSAIKPTSMYYNPVNQGIEELERAALEGDMMLGGGDEELEIDSEEIPF